MKTFLDWLSTLIFLPVFFSIFLLFHIPLFIARAISYDSQKKTLEAMNFCILKALSSIMGICFEIHRESVPPRDTPLIIVSNHQSMYDISLLTWYLREHYPRFISKKELGRGIPSVSYALRTMFLLINRKNPKEAIESIKTYGISVHAQKHAAIIFPEGTRAKDGQLKKFKKRGFLTLCQSMPEAVVVPVVISNSWRLLRHNLLPIPRGITISFDILSARTQDIPPLELLNQVERDIQECLNTRNKEISRN
jgi:1-acyl-sn-glycerol-3-phosphate acyltransferase